jgi:malate dehydrogenase
VIGARRHRGVIEIDLQGDEKANFDKVGGRCRRPVEACKKIQPALA